MTKKSRLPVASRQTIRMGDIYFSESYFAPITETHEDYFKTVDFSKKQHTHGYDDPVNFHILRTNNNTDTLEVIAASEEFQRKLAEAEHTSIMNLRKQLQPVS